MNMIAGTFILALLWVGGAVLAPCGACASDLKEAENQVALGNALSEQGKISETAVAYAWGKPLNGLRLGLYQADAKGDVKPRLMVVLDNVSSEDLVLNLGDSLARGKKHWLMAMRLNLTDTNGRKRVLLPKPPKMDDLHDALTSPFVVQLVAGGRYLISSDLSDVFDAKDVDASIAPGKYRATAEFVGRALIRSKTDTGPRTYLELMTCWTGTIQSDDIQVTLPAKPVK